MAEIIAGLNEAEGFALAGGAALILRGVVERSTRDLDFFGLTTTAVETLVPAVEDALRAAGLTVEHVQRSPGRWRTSPLPTGSLQAPRARMRASDLDWCEALLSGDFERIEIEGDRELALAPLGALAAALRMPAAPSAARRRPRATV